jgi:hypothetical protein
MAVEILQEGFPAIPSPDEHRYTFADAEATRVYMRDLVRALTSQFNFQKTDADKLNASIVPFTSPLTTKGDLYAYSTLDARFPVGTNNHFIVADSAQALGIKYRALLAADLPVGSILQVTTGTLTTRFTTASTSWTALTGLSASITPASSSNKILVLYNVSGVNDTDHAHMRLVRTATPIAVGTTATGSRVNSTGGNFYDANGNKIICISGAWLDSPATASSVTYSVDVITVSSTLVINGTVADTDASHTEHVASSITLLEVKG